MTDAAAMIERLRHLADKAKYKHSEADNAMVEAAALLSGLSAELTALKAERAWISVKDRLPRGYETVLVWRDDIPREIGAITAFWTGEKWCSDVTEPEYIVTHWQPLPQPPTKQTNK